MLAKLFGRPLARRAAEDWSDSPAVWSSGDIGPNYAGRVRTLAGSRVSEDIAHTHSAVWRATRILAELVGGLPCITYRRQDDDGRVAAADLLVYDLCKTAPNPEMGAVPFREGRTMHQCNWGGGFAEIERTSLHDPTAEPVALWPIHPTRVRPTWQTDGVDRATYPYMVRSNDASYSPMKRHEILHVPGALSEDGVWAKGVISYARESIGGAFSVDRHGYAYFASGAQPKGVVKLPAPLIKDPEQRKAYRKEWKEFHGSPDSNEVLLMPPDGEYTPIPINNADSQFLDSRKFSVGEIARWYGLPVYLFGVFEMAAARASIEAQGIELIIYSFMPWIRKWESELNLKLLSQSQRAEYFIEHNLAGLVRGDLKTRMEAYRTAIQIGLMTINEARRLENMSGIGPAGDLNYVPLNMTTADAMAESPPRPGDKAAGADPFGKPSQNGDGENAIDGPAGGTAGAFDQWTRKAVVQLAARADGKRTRRKRSAVIHIEDQPDPSALRTAARGVLASVFERFATKEAKAAERAAKGDWDGWLAGDFYAKHETQLAAALRPAGELLTAIGVAFDAAATAAKLCAAGRGQLHLAYNTATKAAFAAKLERWPAAMATAGADGVMGDVPCAVADSQ